MDLEEYTVEKNMIANVPLKYGKKLLVKERKDYLIFKFAERSAQIEDLQYEEDFIDVAKKINYKFSFNKKYQIPKKPAFVKETPKRQEIPDSREKTLKMMGNDVQNNYETRSSMKLSFREKIFVTFKASKIMNIKIEGQLVFLGSSLKKEAFLKLSNFWKNPQKIKFQPKKNNYANILKTEDDLYR